MTFISKRFEVVPVGDGDAFASRTGVFEFASTSSWMIIGQSSKFNVDAAAMMRYDVTPFPNSELNWWGIEAYSTDEEDNNVYPFDVKIGILEYDGLWDDTGFTDVNYEFGADLPFSYEGNGTIIPGKMWQDNWIGAATITSGAGLSTGSKIVFGDGAGVGITHQVVGSLAKIKEYIADVHVSGAPIGFILGVPDRPDLSLQRVNIASEHHVPLAGTVLELQYSGIADGIERTQESVDTRARVKEKVGVEAMVSDSAEAPVQVSGSVGGTFRVRKSIDSSERK